MRKGNLTREEAILLAGEENEMTRLNLTQHPSTPEQGCIEVEDADKTRIKKLLTFEELPSRNEIKDRAEELARLAATIMSQQLGGDEFPEPTDSNVCGAEVMIGGAPFLMAPLEEALEIWGMIPVYAFSRRESVEKIVDGKTEKVSVFNHLGFVK